MGTQSNMKHREVLMEAPGGSAVQKVRPVCQQGLCVGWVLWTIHKIKLLVLLKQLREKKESLFPEHVNIQRCSPPTAFLWTGCRERFGSLKRASIKGLWVWCRHGWHVNVKELSLGVNVYIARGTLSIMLTGQKCGVSFSAVFGHVSGGAASSGGSDARSADLSSSLNNFRQDMGRTKGM